MLGNLGQSPCILEQGKHVHAYPACFVFVLFVASDLHTRMGTKFKFLIISSAFNNETVSRALDTIHLDPPFEQNNNEQYTKTWHWKMFRQTAVVHCGSSFNPGQSDSEVLNL